MRILIKQIHPCIAAFFLVWFLMSCGGNTSNSSSNDSPVSSQTSTVIGNITDVQPSSFFGLESLTLVDEDGNQWQFDGRDVAVPGFAASHLREHMILGMAIMVTYENDGGVLVVKDIKDASESTPP
jgi:hypothetical protein